mmetsp:Transcript_16900/g.28067  ORF Transcript_16900/g.28067 Transcript_16900/m.28067 type:complete len:134 (-) Transcript_16900:60-461(-)
MKVHNAHNCERSLQTGKDDDKRYRGMGNHTKKFNSICPNRAHSQIPEVKHMKEEVREQSSNRGKKRNTSEADDVRGRDKATKLAHRLAVINLAPITVNFPTMIDLAAADLSTADGCGCGVGSSGGSVESSNNE